MISGFPEDFPVVPDKENMKGLFIRSECDPDSSSDFVTLKRPKIQDIQDVNGKNEPVEYDILYTDNRKVKFSEEPPEEYFTFPDSDYDRTSFRKKMKRYLIDYMEI